MDSEANYFFVKLNPPRPTFPGDISEAERAVMQEHGAYWRELTRRGAVVVFGVVLDPEFTHGVGVFEVENEEKVWEVIADALSRKPRWAATRSSRCGSARSGADLVEKAPSAAL